MSDEMTCEAVVLNMRQAIRVVATTQILWTALNTMLFFEVHKK